MANDYMFIAFMIALAVVCLWFAFRLAKSAQKAIDEDKKKAGNGKSDSYSWIAHIHWIIGALGGVGAALKYAYKSWETAPVGSAVKLGWEALVAVLFCLGLWALFKYIDSKVYGAEAPNYSRIDYQSAQNAIRQMGENIDPINR